MTTLRRTPARETDLTRDEADRMAAEALKLVNATPETPHGD